MKEEGKNNIRIKEILCRFGRRMTEGLAPRILTVILIVFLPMCAATFFAVQMVLKEASDQITQSRRRELTIAMDNMQEHITGIDSGMDDFVSDYVSELNTHMNNYDIVPYQMLDSLEGILSRTGLAGYVYLYDIKNDRVYLKYQMLQEPVRELEEKKRLLCEYAGQQESGVYTVVEVGGSDCIFKTFSYANYRIGFLFELPSNILSQLLINPQGYELYYTGSGAPRRLYGDGSTELLQQDWEALTHNSIRYVNYVWQSEVLGLSVAVQESSSRTRELIPLGHWVFAVLLAGGLLLFPFLWYMLRLEVLRPLEKLWGGMRRLAEGDSSYRIDDHTKRNSAQMQFLFDNFDTMAEEIEKSREKELRMVKAELDNLRLQVNPHMLLNSYNMIYSLAQTKNYACIQDYTMYLVEYFRYVLRKKDDFVSVGAELAFIKNYIEIQKIRFPDAFTCVYQVEGECLDAVIPPFLIENFVENSMKYALIPGKRIEILLNIRREEEMLLISICDTGKGIRPEVLAALKRGEPYVDKHGNRHIGITNCMRRVEVFYDRKAQLGIVSARGEGTQVFLRVPYRRMEEGGQ